MTPATCLAAQAGNRQRIGLDVTGAVQGVGFRPFVYRLAASEGLAGFVRNTGSGVSLEIEGEEQALVRFLARLVREVPQPAVIEQVERTPLVATGEAEFAIVPSKASGVPLARIMPDLAMCEHCRAEIGDPADRRYRYPFTTCMHCGPRYSIIEAVPWDRARTSMRHFAMCAACQAEYDDPASRRFHAEANACPDCGPQLALRAADGETLATGDEALERAAMALREGRIVALKGLGGFQLLADARSEAAVADLRLRKHRRAKPFAVMAGSLADACALAHLSMLEEELLQSQAAPIVLLRARADAAAPLASGVAPGNPNVGVMLPYTPLHRLLMDALGFPVVATSGNRGGEPISASDEDAFARLSAVADLFLTHDRPILRPVDDSVVRVIAGEVTVIRSARGLTPLVLADPAQDAPLLALGGHQKNSIALARDRQIVLGPHVGDLDTAEAHGAFARSAEGLMQLYGLKPEHTACDTHPDYHTTRVAAAMGVPLHKAPHHLAHVLAAVLDSGLDGPVLGIAWDGTGHGGDGTIWGGEFLAVDGKSWRRAAHLLPFRLPGGDAAVREPRRAAVGALHAVFGEAMWAMDDLVPLAAFAPKEREVLRTMLARGLNSPLTSSAGRLFDAVAALLGLCQRASFEGEAAMAVEFAANRATGAYSLPPPIIPEGEAALHVDWRPMLAALARVARSGVAAEALAAGFHDWLAQAGVEVARRIGIERVVLTGGCFQNGLLTERVMERLQAAGFRPYRHRRVPPNDGGLAVGQAAFAARRLKEEKGRCALPYPAKS